jgi:hypothetical protein
MSKRAFFTLVTLATIGCTQAKGPPTYHKDIAPLFATQCAQCHQDGGIAPFALTTYADVKDKAQQIAFAVDTRLMPPSTIDDSGSCQTFDNARWLSDEQIATIKDWADSGAPEGDPLPPPPLPTLDSLDDANFSVEMPEEYQPVPSSDHPNDDYRCFVLDGPEADGFVTGYEILPGVRREVHHMILVASLDAQTDQSVQALDDADPGPGFSCFSNIFDGNVNVLAGWAPGKDVVRYPDQTGLQVKGGHKLVMQIHYNLLSGPPLPDATALKLRTVPTVAKEAMIAPIADDGLTVPPGKRNASYSFIQPLAGMTGDIEVYGVFPHMHTLGQTLSFSLHPLNDDNPKDSYCMADVWKWDFHWQQLFFYNQPITVTPDDVISVTCTYDTSHRTTPVTWGEGTQDEMCLVGVYIARPNGGSLDGLFPN